MTLPMLQPLYDLPTVLLSICEYATVIPAAAMCLVIARDLLRWPRRRAVAATALALAVYLVFSTVCNTFGAPLIVTDWTSPLFSVFMLLAFWHISALDFWRALFVTMSCASIMAMCAFCGQCAQWLASGVWWPPLGYPGWVCVAVEYALALAAVLILRKPACRLMPGLLRSPVIVPAAWRVLWIAPFGLYFLLIQMRTLTVDVSATAGMRLSMSAAFMYFALLMLLYWLLSKVDRESARRAAVERENRQLTVSWMQGRNLTERVEEARRSRHDLRQHLVTMRGYVQQQDVAGLNRYLDGLIADADIEGALTVCDHVAVNSVVAYYVAQARHGGVEPDVRLDLPSDVRVDDTDLTVIFGNLLENAVDAVLAQVEAWRAGRTDGGVPAPPHGASLTVRSHVGRDGVLFLTVDNTYAGRVRRTPQGQLRSGKHDGEGVGVQSVHAAVERLGGEMRVDADRGVFQVSVMVPPQS